MADMGEAKRRAGSREQRHKLSKPMKRARFDLYAIGSRQPPAAYMADELSWWASHDEKLIGMVALDTTDNDFLWMILARDQLGRFRCCDLEVSLKSQRYAEVGLRNRIADVVEDGDIEGFGFQGDEIGEAINLLHAPLDVDPDTLHPYFRLLLEAPGRAPGRAVIREIGPWLMPSDPHLASEFRTKGFDQRLWEIYLWAVFREFNLQVQQLEAPDFLCEGIGCQFTVEATTVAPSLTGVLAEHPNPKGTAEIQSFIDGYMAMKFGSALKTKLEKENAQGLRYWQRPESTGIPFLIAIADFHKPADQQELGSMTYTQGALWQYLYGSRVEWELDDGLLVLKPEAISQHKYKTKTIPSGYFDLPDAENVSAVVFSNAGTLAKFDRMGVVAGFGAPGHLYQRMGFRYNPDPNATIGLPFSEDVADPRYEEYWSQEIQVFHNPNALRPLPFDALAGATHHHFKDGVLNSTTPSDAILSSYTMLTEIKDEVNVDQRPA